jgi:hypothetical protein
MPAISTWVLFLASRAASADCHITGMRPTVALPTMVRGQAFSFVASDDCETLRFSIRGTSITRVPVHGTRPDTPGSTTYKVELDEREWNQVVAESGSTLTWVVTGRTHGGDVTRVSTTNDIDVGVSLDLSLADAVLFGEGEGDSAGSSLAAAGDVNGDGHLDVLIGAPYAGTDAPGAVYLVSRPGTGTLDLSLANAKLVGTAPHEWAGISVASAGDVDDDGYGDVLIGAPGHGDPAGHTRLGAAYLVLGPVTGTFDLSSADATFVGVTGGESAGESVSSAGDVNGDGRPDLLIGAPLRSTPSTYVGGAAYVVTDTGSGTHDLSAAHATLFGEHSNDIAGNSVSGLGDVDGDGIDDILVAAHVTDDNGYNSGTSYVLFGPVSGGESQLADVADVRIIGEVLDDYAGGSTAAAGDVDADGLRDILIGAAYNDEGGLYAGAAYLVRGGTVGPLGLADADAKLVGENADDQAGVCVSGAGDVDADGHDDLLVAAGGDDTGGRFAGAAYLVSGPVAGSVDLSRADLKLIGEHALDYVSVVAGAGDLDEDGRADVLVGGPYNSERGRRAGATYVLYGGGL